MEVITTVEKDIWTRLSEIMAKISKAQVMINCEASIREARQDLEAEIRQDLHEYAILELANIEAEKVELT